MPHLEREKQAREISSSSESLKISGRVLWLTKDPSLISRQIEGEDLSYVSPENLLDRISTDQIIPSQWCMSYSDGENLSRYLLTGLEGINPGDIKGKFQAIVAGKSFGQGSSREHVQLALMSAGINVVITESCERIFDENCRNNGIFSLSLEDRTSRKLLEGEFVDLDALLMGRDYLSRRIILNGGLLEYTKARLGRVESVPEPESIAPGAMTIAEKIIAKNVKRQDEIGVDAVRPHQAVIVSIDSGYAYELQSVVTREVLEQTFGQDAPLRAEKFILFEDHLALMESDDIATIRHRREQAEFAQKYGIKLYSVSDEGVEGICHTVMLDKHILPGQLVLGNDSHTCTGGAANALAIGKGASDFAAALLTEDIAILVPESIRFNLQGHFQEGVTSKDLMLYILSMPQFKDDFIGSRRVFEFGGRELDDMPFDDQVVLANMAIEGQGFTGIIEPNRQLVRFMQEKHNLTSREVNQMLVYPDKNADYAYRFNINLSEIEKMIAMPGNTQNGVPLSSVLGVSVDLAYIGSCTGGKIKDLREVADILKGRKIHPNIRMKIQASSLSVFRQAESEGLLDVFKSAGAQIVKPGCGDCMGATKDAFEKEEIVISDTNRNFPRRMGSKRTVYLANPGVVAASAVAGEICDPEDLN